MINNRTQPSLSRDFALLSVFIIFILVLASIWVTFETYGNYEKDVAKQMEREALRLDRGLIVEIEQLAYEIQRLYDYINERRRVEAELRLKNAELTRVKEAAHITNQVKADFFAYVGQELTEPVEAIMQQIETLKDQHFGPIGNNKYLAHAADIHDQTKQLMAMLEDIKAISKAETGLLALNESDIDLAFVLQKTIRIFREKSGVDSEVHVDINNSLPHVRGDELRIKQLVLNILNAIAQQVTAAEPIRITSSLKAQELSLSFSYTASSALLSATRSKQGLDLALARLLIALHQGSLEMKTTADRLSIITIKFPALRVCVSKVSDRLVMAKWMPLSFIVRLMLSLSVSVSSATITEPRYVPFLSVKPRLSGRIQPCDRRPSMGRPICTFHGSAIDFFT
jgi:signal transduction histidine kinase